MIKIFSVFGMMGLLFLIGCASGGYKARLDHREKQASSAGLYCEWIDGDKHSDLDVEINLQMAKRCDSNKPFTLTPYKNSSDANGVMYCCAMRDLDSKAPASSKRKSSGPAVTQSGSSTPSPTKASADESGGASASSSVTTKAGTPAAKDSGPATDDDEIVEDK